MRDKVFSISVDNGTTNTKAIEYLMHESSFTKILNGEFLHIRCSAHVLNLAVQEGIKKLSPLLDPIRMVIRWTTKERKYKRKF